ncbi:unnamed protein product [Somion occarium]|uniref:DUF3835 domain-containing protein n=1 Tax=Somion occarium TaxID=3059160 RepID=A0ABP1DEV1_9APHY
MSSLTGTVKNLNDSRVQALQALLTIDQIRNLTDKIGEILGDETEITQDESSDQTKRNEKGELVNEEGLPIVDISEPVVGAADTTFATASNLDHPDLLPLWAISASEKERRKAERERILEILEEEERIQHTRDEAAAREKWKAELERRKEAGKAEMERLKKAKELQKKMGRALIRSVVEARENEAQEVAALQEEESTQRPAETPTSHRIKPKKSVSFAPDVDEQESPSEEKGKAIDWGDVAPARLRPSKSASLLTKSQEDKQPMKMQVVERIPGVAKKAPTPEPESICDSDDESVPDDNTVYDSEDDQKESRGPADSDLSDEDVEWEEDDLDFARHQREVALAYYEKRATMTSEVSAAMKAHSHDNDNEWDQPEVPLDATLASPPPKAPVSRFKSSLVSRSATTTMASHSLGQAVLPASQSSSIKSAIRMGKLKDGKLVGEPGESDDDVEEEARTILELLQKGEVTNIGPQPVPKSIDSQESKVTSVARPEADSRAPEAKLKSKVSRFKAAMASTPSPLGPDSPGDDSDLNTPICFTERSSPKLSSPQIARPKAHPIAVPSSSSQPPPKPQPGPSRVRNSATQKLPSPDALVANPPLPQPQSVHTLEGLPAASFHPVTNPFSMIIDSPSFLPRGVVESPSAPAQPPASSASAKARVAASNARPAASVQKVTDRPPVVIAAEVKESKPLNRGSERAEPRQRVSRFLAERM